jgi:hypothetical protein
MSQRDAVAVGEDVEVVLGVAGDDPAEGARRHRGVVGDAGVGESVERRIAIISPATSAIGRRRCGAAFAHAFSSKPASGV